MSTKKAASNPLSPSNASPTSIARHSASACPCPITYKATHKSKEPVVPSGPRKDPTAPLVFPSDALAPLPPSGVADNLLLARVAGSDIMLTVTVPDTIEVPDLDMIQILVNGNPVGERVTFDGFQPGDTFSITLKAGDRPEGTHQISYRVFYFFSQTSVDGPSVAFTVDLTAPGLPILAPLLIDDDIVNNGLTPGKLKTDIKGQYLESFVPSYNVVKPGDVIQCFINGVLTKNSETTVGEVGPGEDVELRIYRTDIETAGDGSLEFRYLVHDRAGNISLMSVSIMLRVLLKGEIDDLLPPLVPLFADDNIINEADARTPVQVTIPGHAEIQPGDSVVVVWGGVTLSPLPIPPGGEGNDPLQTVNVPYAALYDTWKAATNGSDALADIAVSYHIMRMELPAGQSPATPVKVNLFQAGGDPDPEDPVHPNLRLALLVSAGGSQNEIPVGDFEQNAAITVFWLDRQIPAREVFLLGDKVNLTYGSFTFPERTITALDVGNRRDLVFTLTAEDIGKVGSGTHILQYTITRPVVGNPDETENTSLAPPQDVVVMGSDQLPGEGVLPIATFTPLAVTGAIGPEEARQGVSLVMAPYKNMAPRDVIEFSFVQSSTHQHQPGELPIEATRIEDDRTLGDLDVGRNVVFSLNAQALMQLRSLNHAHVVWSVENDHGKVTNVDTFVVVDARGWPGTEEAES